MSKRICILAAVLCLGFSPLGQAASSAQPVTPLSTSVEAGQSQVFSARFFDAAGNPAAGEMVQFSNDACGTFPNGLSQQTVAADGMGVATITFTASTTGGITCRLIASAGANVTFSLVIYQLNLVTIAYAIQSIPGGPRPGQPFSIDLSVTFGVHVLKNLPVTAQIIVGSNTAATISPLAGNTGQQGVLGFNVFPESLSGDFLIEFAFGTVKRRVPVRIGSAVAAYTDLWWALERENGWGMSMVQHGDTLFSVIYAYADDGRPTWYVMSGGTWNATFTEITGPLYSPRGTPFYAYDAAGLQIGAPVGTATITFQDPSNATLEFTINGKPGIKSISRQPFGPIAQTSLPNRGDMFWGGLAQNGWGVAALQQYASMFLIWFTYDAAGLPTWFVMPAGAWTTSDTYEGRMYRTTSSSWLGVTYNPAALSVIDVGTFRLDFTGDTTATLNYTNESRTGTLNLSRQPF